MTTLDDVEFARLAVTATTPTGRRRKTIFTCTVTAPFLVGLFGFQLIITSLVPGLRPWCPLWVDWPLTAAMITAYWWAIRQQHRHTRALLYYNRTLANYLADALSD